MTRSTSDVAVCCSSALVQFASEPNDLRFQATIGSWCGLRRIATPYPLPPCGVLLVCFFAAARGCAVYFSRGPLGVFGNPAGSGAGVSVTVAVSFVSTGSPQPLPEDTQQRAALQIGVEL